MIFAASEAVFKFYVFRSFSIPPGLLSHFTGQFSNITPQSCQTPGREGVELEGGGQPFRALTDFMWRRRELGGPRSPTSRPRAACQHHTVGGGLSLLCAMPPGSPLGQAVRPGLSCMNPQPCSLKGTDGKPLDKAFSLSVLS